MRNKQNASVFGNKCELSCGKIVLRKPLVRNKPLKLDGLQMLGLLPNNQIPVAFFDPQYRGVLDKLAYGNEGNKRGKQRSALVQMPSELISRFIREIDRVLVPSGHLFLWVDKFHLCQGISPWLADTSLAIVDLVNWNKDKLGMGYRTRRVTEHCVVLQKSPCKAKGVWQVHTIRDTVTEKINGGVRRHPHVKPLKLQASLIEAVSSPGDLVIDPAAGSFSVLDAARLVGRDFLGCDLRVPPKADCS